MKNNKNDVKLPKIKISQQELNYFPSSSLVIDPFWYDLYGIEVNNNNYEKIKRNNNK